MAMRRLFRPHWSPQILDEVRRSDRDAKVISRRLDLLDQALLGAMTSVPGTPAEAMPINEKDRHVLALGPRSVPGRW
jgi:hypothetical protein